jgi:putative lipoprotein (rSAM/lipoprotein system)
MKHIVSAWRLTLRYLLTALLGSLSLLFGTISCSFDSKAAYGMPPPDRINGKVTYDENPVPGFWVSVLGDSSSGPYTFTDKDGLFELSVNHYGDYPYTLFFQDVDGHLNGEFNSKTVQWTWGDNPLHIVLEPKE